MQLVPRALVPALLFLVAGCASGLARPDAPTSSPERRAQQERMRDACLEATLAKIPDGSTRARFCDCSSERIARSLPVDVLSGDDSSAQAREAFASTIVESWTDCSREVGLPAEDPVAAASPGDSPSRPSIVQVIVAEPATRRVVTGSGFYVTEHLVATNHHVVRNHPSVGVAVEGAEPLVARVLYVDPALDFAVVASPVEGEPLEIRDGPVEDGEAVLAWGFPQGRRRIAFSSGTVRAADEVFIVHDALIAAGSSGGPLTDADGKVLGIVTFLAKSRGDAANESDRGIAVRMNLILRSIAARAKAGEARAARRPPAPDRSLHETDLPPPRGTAIR